MNPLRWRQRLENFERALNLLQEAVDIPDLKRSTLESEGLIQRFEYTYELAWNTLKDYLEYSGIKAEPSPRAIIKAGFAAEIITDGLMWMEILDNRNLMSHTYDEASYKTVLVAITTKYIDCINQLFLYLKAKADEV